MFLQLGVERRIALQTHEAVENDEFGIHLAVGFKRCLPVALGMLSLKQPSLCALYAESAPYVSRAEMKRREQGQIVVVHPPSIARQRCIKGTAAKEHDSAAAADSRECVRPSGDLPSAFDDQIRPKTTINLCDGLFSAS